MKVGFIGLGSVGGKLAGSLLRNGALFAAHDLNTSLVQDFRARGAVDGGSPGKMVQDCDVVITCLPSPAACARVMAEMLPHIKPGKIWMEMSTTDAQQIKDHAAQVISSGGEAVDCPVSGGCHRADTGNISIYAGCTRGTFETVLPVLAHMGRRILHVGPVGAASTLKVMTNYLATMNLLSLCEALTVMKAAGMDLAMTYEAIAMSSGNSFVHETESQLILSGSRDVNFTLDLVQKDVGLFQKLADDHGITLELLPKMLEMLSDGQRRYGEHAQSDRMIERLEDQTGLSITAPGFPKELIDDEPEERGYEVIARR
ncbi:MAG: NAD(P)-dependent oxidoreductase [Pseudomonadota bacterium]